MSILSPRESNRAVDYVGTVRVLLIILLFSLTAKTQADNPHQTSVNNALLHDLCGKQIVLLGESPTHGFGKTMQWKAQIVQELIETCHFKAVFFESGIYDFLHIQKELASRHDVTESTIANAIGGLWANQDVEPLLPFLLEKLQKREVILGGIDDQLGRGTYAQLGMSDDLVQYLDGDARTQCLSILRKHTLWQYTSESPYSPADKSRIVDCLGVIGAAISRAPATSFDRAADLAMIDSLQRMFARDFRADDHSGADPNTQDVNARDSSMYQNFKWLMSRVPRDTKVIVWTASNHAARDLHRVPGREKTIPLGSYIARDFGNRYFALAFTASSGAYALGSHPASQLTAAPDLSLEQQAFARNSGDTHYFDKHDLQRMGPVESRALGTGFVKAKWDEVFDGILVFREERPPQRKR